MARPANVCLIGAAAGVVVLREVLEQLARSAPMRAVRVTVAWRAVQADEVAQESKVLDSIDGGHRRCGDAE